MARIPTGPGRRIMPAPVPPGVSAGAMAGMGAAGAALQRLGETGVQVGTDMMARETRYNEALRDKAERSTAAVRMGESKIQLQQTMRGLTDRVLAGDVDETGARQEWSDALQKTLSTATNGVPTDLAGELTAHVRLQADEMAGQHLDSAFRTRYREVSRGNLTTMMEGFERDAMTDRPKALNSAGKAMQQLGAAAGYGPDDQVRLMQAFREKTAFNSGLQLMDSARGNIDALQQARQRIASDEFADVSPERRVMLDERIQNRIAGVQHQQEVQRQRAEAALERRLREAEHSFKAAQGVYDGGATMDDKALAVLQQQVAGTPYAAAVKSLVVQGAERASFGSMTPVQQEQALISLRGQMNEQGTSPAGLDRLRRLETINAQSRELAEKEPLRWAQQSRLLGNITPLDMSNGLPGVVSSLASRVDEARTVGAQLGKPVSPLLKSEAQFVGETLGSLPLDQKKNAVRTLAAALPAEQQRALAGQINDRDPALALAMHAASLPAGSGPDVVDLMLRGQDAVKAGRIKADDVTSKGDRLQIAKDIAAVPWPTTRARDAAADAAGLVYDGQRDLKGSGNRREAIRLATGGGIVDWGDGKTLLPPGWTESRFKAGMRAVKPDDITRQARGPLFIGGAEVQPAALLKALPSATLVPVGPGQYAIDAGGVVTNAQRRPFIFSLGG